LNIKTPIVDGLNKYLSENHKPWHMPGHKHRSDGSKYNMVENREVNIYARFKRNIG
jgi:arginine/lysine/ornithine decarboxylase